MKRHIKPVAKASGIHKKIGWHTFRHSFGTLLKANGEDVKTVQELLIVPLLCPDLVVTIGPYAP
jgi:site-specific recombinase XerD